MGKEEAPKKEISQENKRNLQTILRRVSRVLKEFCYGMTIYELQMEANKERHQLDHLFMLVVFGDLVGLPLLPPYYSMRLLPYVIPSINRWKRSILREKDLTDLASVDL